MSKMFDIRDHSAAGGHMSNIFYIFYLTARAADWDLPIVRGELATEEK
jgi:hypothetical protein